MSDWWGRLFGARCPSCRRAKPEICWQSDGNAKPQEVDYRCPECKALFTRVGKGPLERREPTLLDEQELRRRYARPACKMVLGSEELPETPTASWFGKVLLQLPGEKWPHTSRAPFVPVCQINCSELPYRPESLQDVALLTLMMENPRKLAQDQDDPWVIRTYASLENLVPVEAPVREDWLRPRPIRWELIEDWPFPEDVPDDLTRALAGSGQLDHVDNCSSSKVGGWPWLVQPNCPVFEGGEPELTLQIAEAPEARWEWGDTGVWYFARVRFGEHWDWDVDQQCF